MKVAIVGASGFVGRALLEALQTEKDLELTALSRSVPKESKDRVRWVSCDLHNLKDLEQALTGQDVAIYLVHSMLPTARLNQGNFADFDLILADNFARAARLKGVQHVIYLSGFIPDEPKLSEHLQSRLEVEQTLQAYLPTTALRTGIILGAAGSSFTIVLNLVRRLPIMLCPRWTLNLCQIISLKNVIDVIKVCLREKEVQGKTWDIGAEPPISYLDMMKETAAILNYRRYFQAMPLMSLGLSKLWVRLISGAPKNLVYPLIDSLKSSMQVRASHRFPEGYVNFMPFREAVVDLLPALKRGLPPKPYAFARGGKGPSDNRVRSIQRLPLPPGRDAAWVAEEYLRYLPQLLPFLITVQREGPLVEFRLKLLGLVLLRLRYAPERSRPDRQLFYVVGGLLYRRSPWKARLEMREALGKTACLVALNDFRPALPWLIYVMSQAQVHRWFMQKFARHLQVICNFKKDSASHPGQLSKNIVQ